MAKKLSFVMTNVYRAKWFAAHHLTIFSKFLMKVNALFCNCFIDYRADIDKSVKISHNGSGVVINADASIGHDTIVAHAVTIGNRMPLHSGAPKIGNNVYIGSGAYIGGGVTIGDNAKIGANASVVKDIPENATAVGNPARIILPKKQAEINNNF